MSVGFIPEDAMAALYEQIEALQSDRASGRTLPGTHQPPVPCDPLNQREALLEAFRESTLRELNHSA